MSRTYGQYCALARSLDVVGDRWALLIGRNLLLGPQRWTELRANLPGVAKNLLSSRLRALSDAGVIEELDGGYGLTPVGHELRAVVFALADWGERHHFGEPRPGEAFRLRYLMTSLWRRMRTTERRAAVALYVDGEPFTYTLGATPRARQGADSASAGVTLTVDALIAAVMRGEPTSALEASGSLRIEGDRDLWAAWLDSIRRRER